MTEHIEAKAFYFEDYCIGDQYESISHTLSSKEIINFAKIWDPQPFHTDEQYAKDSHFGGLTACSAHIFSVFCRISQQWKINVKQQALASLGFDEMRMRLPVYAGDTLHCLTTVQLARPSKSKQDRGVVSNHCELLNQNDKVVFSITASFLMLRRCG